jgi:hypothetical protein
MFRFFFAEKEGFEPPDLLQSTVFKTAAFDRSAISPECLIGYSPNASANIESFLRVQNKKKYFLFFIVFLSHKH